MIFNRGEHVDLKNPQTDLAKETSRTITEFASNFFGKDKKGFCQLRYPNGVRVKNKSGMYEPKKIFFLDLVSFDGVWRWCDTMPRGGQFKYKNGNHFKVSDPYLFYEKDKELVWFLKTHCPQFASGKVYFEDFEAEAEKEAKERIMDVDIKFTIFSGKSTVGNNIPLLRDVADVFGVEDVNTLGRYELKNKLFDAVVAGENVNSKYVNFEIFEELTDNEAKMKAASTIRKAIKTKQLVFNNREKAWYTHSGDTFLEQILKLKPNDVPEKENVLLNRVLNDKQFKGMVYSELGIVGYESKAEVRDLGFPALKKICKDEKIVIDKGDNMDVVVDKYCERFEIEV